MQFVDTIRIIIKYLKLLQHVSDRMGSIIRELYVVKGKGKVIPITGLCGLEV